MHQWVYVSKCIVPDADIQNAIDSIIKVSQSRNMDLQVTGALFFTGTHFAQLLEGPPGGMMTLRSSILADPRHKDALTMLEGRIEQRRFHGWALAYSGPSLVLS
ncbi:BLUF domain-containing protein [Devosia sediminis]|uniref:BLUF domain-containing protein n=1 Tax=Devosia sediminis TaxID=2798801 RepID=A0A934IQ25_9HYPH|nr:BLUF domain-containing protein [Devosia sediminis]MBJ3783096.1 BLUF domain-containing protein [Devosia sediminis]